MQVNRISNITFKEEMLAGRTQSENAILMLRDPNASIKFKQSQEYARKADSIDSNPIVALGYKLYRTFNMIKGENARTENRQLNVVA